LEGIIVATIGFFSDGAYERKRIVPKSLSEYNQGAYDVVPGKCGYERGIFLARFPLTEQTGRGKVWTKSFK
jgi:hypothetical protein